jgi:predicted small metal-binding protein
MAEDYMTTGNVNTTNPGNQKLHFRCSDVGPRECDWQTSGNTEQEILAKAEQHGREQHNLKIDDNTRTRVKSAIRREAA